MIKLFGLIVKVLPGYVILIISYRYVEATDQFICSLQLKVPIPIITFQPVGMGIRTGHSRYDCRYHPHDDDCSDRTWCTTQGNRTSVCS